MYNFVNCLLNSSTEIYIPFSDSLTRLKMCFYIMWSFKNIGSTCWNCMCLRISMQLYKGFGPFFRSTAAVSKRRQWDVCNIWQLFMVQSSLHTYLVKYEFDCEVSHHDFYALYFHRYMGQLLLVQLRGFFKT